MVAAQTDDATPSTKRLRELRAQRDALTPTQRRSMVTGEVDALVDTYLAAAKQHPGDAAVPFLADALELANNRATARAVVQAILSEHTKNSALAAIGPQLPTLKTRAGIALTNELLAKLEKDTPSAVLRGWVAMARLEPSLVNGKPGVGRYDATKAELEKALAGLDDKALRARFDALFATASVEPNAIASDIAGVDLDGVAFKLSDYKGKVVLLDFWGDW